ncbi:MAG: PAS domain S-box protein, partial [Pseudomonadota bacterium]
MPEKPTYEELEKRVMELEQAEFHRDKIEKVFRHREDLFRSYFDLGLVGMAITSIDKHWVQYNNRLCEILGYPRVELTRKTWAELTHPDDLEADEVQFNRVLAGEINGYSMDKRFIQKNGTIIHAAISAQCVRKPDGSVRHFVAIANDITERKRAETQLIKSEERLNLALTASEQGWFELNFPTGAIEVSPRYAKMLGFEPDEFHTSYQQWKEALHPDDRENVLRLLRECIETRDSRWIEYRRRSKGGDWVWIRSVGKVIEYGPDNTPIRMTGTHVDITKQKRAELALRASELKLREMFDNMNAGVAIFSRTAGDGDFIIEDVNRMGELIEDVKKENVIGKNLLELFPGLTSCGILEALQRVWETGNPERIPAFEYKDSRISGWREGYLFKLVSGEVVATYTDETRRKQAERLLQDSETRFRLLLKNTVMGVFIITGQNIVYLDPEKEIACGSLFGSFMTGYFEPGDVEKIGNFYREILASGNSKEGLELRFSPAGNAAAEE